MLVRQRVQRFFLSFKYKGKTGDAITLRWADNQGDSGQIAATVK